MEQCLFRFYAPRLDHHAYFNSEEIIEIECLSGRSELGDVFSPQTLRYSAISVIL